MTQTGNVARANTRIGPSSASRAGPLIVTRVTIEPVGRTPRAGVRLYTFASGVNEPAPDDPPHPRAANAARLLAKPAIRAVRIDSERFFNFTVALRWAIEHLRGTLRNADTGWEVAVARRGLEKTLSGAGHRDGVHIQAIASLAALIENAVLVESRPPRTTDANIKAIHRLYAAALIDSRFYRVKITVKELQAVRNFYDQSLTLIQQSPAAGGALSRESEDNRPEPGEPASHTAAFSAAEGIAGRVDLRINIAELLSGVKYDDGTDVLNFDGDAVMEPRPTGRDSSQTCREPSRRST